jgi:hypothetical protein
MKIFLFVSLFTFLTIGCKKDESGSQSQQMVDTPHVKPPDPPAEAIMPPHAKKALGLYDVALLRTHSSAAKVYLNLPDSALPAPLPPGLRPLKNPKLRDSSGTTVVYNFTTAQGRSGEMVLMLVPYQSDSVWIPVHIVPR